MTILVTILVLAGILVFITWVLGEEEKAARQWMVERGFTLSKFEYSFLDFCCMGGDSRRTFVFVGTRDGVAAKGYLCYGAFCTPVIHYENR
jgi:hypothetical protein